MVSSTSSCAVETIIDDRLHRPHHYCCRYWLRAMPSVCAFLLTNVAAGILMVSFI